MSQHQVSRWDQMMVLRELMSDAASETPRTIQEGIEQQGALHFLQRKFNEISREVMTGD